MTARSWGERSRRHWQHGWRLARQGGERIRRTVAQGAQQARKAGVMMARKVISMQRVAGLDECRRGRKLMVQSVMLTIGERRGPQPDPDWLAGYAAVAVQAGLVPGYEASRQPEAAAATPAGRSTAEPATAAAEAVTPDAPEPVAGPAASTADAPAPAAPAEVPEPDEPAAEEPPGDAPDERAPEPMKTSWRPSGLAAAEEARHRRDNADGDLTWAINNSPEFARALTEMDEVQRAIEAEKAAAGTPVAEAGEPELEAS